MSAERSTLFDERIDLIVILFVLAVDHDHALAGYVHGHIAAIAFNLVQIGLDGLDRQSRRLLGALCVRDPRFGEQQRRRGTAPPRNSE